MDVDPVLSQQLSLGHRTSSGLLLPSTPQSDGPASVQAVHWHGVEGLWCVDHLLGQLTLP